MNSNKNQKIDVILFDLGGVLIELGKEPLPSQWLGGASFDLLDWFKSPTAILFEKGLIDAQEFAERLKDDLSLSVSPQEIITHFTQWPTGLFPEVVEVLTALEGKSRLAVLSNSNELHWPRILNEFKIEPYFEQIFASHYLKMAKPNADIFQHVLAELNVKAENVLFFDDNAENIAAAKELGFQSVQVKGINQVEQYLQDLGML